MTFDELVQQTAAARGTKHPDDIAFLRAELLIGWNAAMTQDQERVVKLRTHWCLLEQDVRQKLDHCNDLLSQYAAGTIRPTRKETQHQVDGEASGYASVLDRIHTAMRELGIDYEH